MLFFFFFFFESNPFSVIPDFSPAVEILNLFFSTPLITFPNFESLNLLEFFEKEELEDLIFKLDGLIKNVAETVLSVIEPPKLKAPAFDRENPLFTCWNLPFDFTKTLNPCFSVVFLFLLNLKLGKLKGGVGVGSDGGGLIGSKGFVIVLNGVNLVIGSCCGVVINFNAGKVFVFELD